MLRGYAAGRMVSPSVVPKGSFNPARPSIEALLAALEVEGYESDTVEPEADPKVSCATCP